MVRWLRENTFVCEMIVNREVSVACHLKKDGCLEHGDDVGFRAPVWTYVMPGKCFERAAALNH